MKKLIIATRKSALAMWQSEFIKSQIEAKHGISVKLSGHKTKGDVILDTPLAKIGGKGLFTKELEEKMLARDAHIAVHSLKDVPVEFPEGLILAAISKREDPRDAFVSEKFSALNELPKGAKVGTTSLRRRMQILIMRPDLEIISLRGNVNTRLKKLKDGEFDAIILAVAGLKRLNLDKEVKFVKPFEFDELIPAMGQGALGIEAIDEAQILGIIDFLNDQNSVIETTIERDFVLALNGGCQVPIGINAHVEGKNVKVRAIVGLPDGSKFLRDEREISATDYKKFGAEFAAEFVAKGAREILCEAEKMVENGL